MKSWRPWLFLLLSYLFYYSLGGWHLALLVASTLFNYACGKLLRRRPRGVFLLGGILLNVALLSTFKYLPAGVDALAHLTLPLGISFWTFQGLSHLFDQYRGEEVDPSLLEMCAYMSFAPTVISGPICRVADLVTQLRLPFRVSAKDLSAGAQRIWIGVCMIVLARLIGAGPTGQGVNWAFQNAATLGTLDVWAALIGYGFLLFYDFAGYTSVVIGIARLAGIGLPENFNRPYLSLTPTLFWQRWHMSLSFWIRDYLFMPLAMMNARTWWRNGLLVLTMVVFGLWHKASWLFLLWGVYQGGLLLAHRLWQQNRRSLFTVPDGVSWLLTFLAVNLGWIFFRSGDLEQAGSLLFTALAPVRPHAASVPPAFLLTVLALAGGYFAWTLLSGALRKDDERGELSWIPLELRFVLYALIFYLAMFRAAEPQAFVYAQF